ncbi:MAG: CDP-alcohol phosphatidyltransferase family protein [Clostridia bacterium]|nr:CDP-alcohol phosphatidyltransferase family protein [Clostridia bacterium]
MKNVPNIITIIRIILSISLLFIEPVTCLFYIIYLTSGFTDILDGFLARKYNITTEFGARLDSIADLIFYAILVWIFLPLITITTVDIVWVVAIALIRFGTLGLTYFKYKTFAFLHTYLNKITSFLVFFYPLVLSYVDIKVILVFATLSAVEELYIDMKANKLMTNIKCALFLGDRLSK